jgi:hypothetical protein
MGHWRQAENLGIVGGVCLFAFCLACAQSGIAAADSLIVTTGTHSILDGDEYELAFALGDSVITMTGGDVTSFFSGTVFGTDADYSVLGASAASFDRATFSFNGGFLLTAESHGFGTFNMSGGFVTASTQSFDSSTFNVTGGEATDFQAYGQSTQNISGGRARLQINAFETSTVYFSGGRAGSFINSYDSSSFFFSGGSVEVGDASSNHASEFFMSGGYVNRFGEAHDTSTFTLTGGTLNQGFRAFDQANIIIEAFDFDYAGGDIDFGGGTELILTASNSIFSTIVNPFGTTFNDSWRVIPDLSMTYADGTFDTFNFYGHIDNFPTGQHVPWTGTLTLRLIPAPAGVALLAMGLLVPRTRRRP